MIGIDISSLIDLYKSDTDVLALLKNVGEEIFMNQMSHLELFLGLNPEKHQNEEHFFNRLFSEYECLEMNFNSNKKARDIFWQLKKKGITIGEFDCAIAGIYLSNGIDKIITRNKKHFEKIKGLKVFSY